MYGELVYVVCRLVFFLFKQKTAYEVRISDWSSDVCSSDLPDVLACGLMRAGLIHNPRSQRNRRGDDLRIPAELPYAAPATPAELLDVLCKFAAQGIDLLIVSGGDGTLREEIGRAHV